MKHDWRDNLNEPHRFTEAQLLRRAFACLFLLAAILFYAYKCEAQAIEQKSDAPLKVAISGYLAFSVIDAGQTHRCLSAGTCREANKLLQPFAAKPSGLVAVKLAANTGVAYGIWKLRKQKPKTALVLGIAAAGFQAAVVGVNAKRAKR
jgi:hypothetical protein